MSEREKKVLSPMQKALQARQARMQQAVNDLKNEVRRFHRAHDEVFGADQAKDALTPRTPAKEKSRI